MDHKIVTSELCSQLYHSLCIDIRSILRGRDYDCLKLIEQMEMVDSQVSSCSPLIPDKIELKYESIFID